MAIGYHNGDSGDTPEQIQMCLNCKKTECTDCISAHYTPVKRRKETAAMRRRKENKRKAKEMFERGLTTRQMSKELGVNINTVLRYLGEQKLGDHKCTYDPRYTT